MEQVAIRRDRSGDSQLSASRCLGGRLCRIPADYWPRGTAGLPRFSAALEACTGAHQWGREIGQPGHEVRLFTPIYVKPFVKRHKNDMADAEAIPDRSPRHAARRRSARRCASWR